MLVEPEQRAARTFIDWMQPSTAGYLLTICMLTALALRLQGIRQYSLWVDEALSYLAASLPVRLILNNAIQDSHPPLYYLLLHFWLPLWPDDDLFLRLFSLSWGILFLPALYWLSIQLLKDRRLSLLAVLFAVISPFHILYSHELRMYTQLIFLVTLAAGAYARGRKTGGLGWWLLFAGASLAALYTHLFTVFFLAGIGGHAALGRQDRRSLWLTIGTGAALFILFLPWLSLIVAETQVETGSLRPLLADVALVVFNPVKPLTVLSFMLFGIPYTALYAGAALFLTLTLVVLLSLEWRKARREGVAEKLSLPIVIVLCVVGLPVVIYYLRPFFLPERTMAVALPFLFILLSWSVTRYKTPLALTAVAALVFMVLGSVFYFNDDSLKTPYREAMAHVRASWQPGDTIVHTSDFSYYPALRYADLPQHVLLDGRPSRLKPEAALKAMGGSVWNLAEIDAAGGRVWLIVALVDNLEWQQEQANYFATHYQQIDRRQVGGIEVLLYQMPPE
jgi:mannosyltransferase